MNAPRGIEDVWRREAPHVLAALLRRHGDLADCEDAVAEATEAALVQWPAAGPPRDPRAWLVRVASRRLVDRVRADTARVRREERAADPAPGSPGHADDSVQLLLLCCHPALSRASQVALTLRSVAGLSVEQVAAAYLVPARTMTQRLTRARSALRRSGAQFAMPDATELPARIAAVLDACYLMFNEGYTRTSGGDLLDVELAQEAIRLTRLVCRVIPDHAEAAGALALMLLTQARAAARTDERGDLVPLAEQDRRRWDRDLIGEGVAVLEETLPRGHVGPFQIQAAIAAVHAEAVDFAATDWTQIALLYAHLHDLAPSPVVTLNRAVAVAMVQGPEAGLSMVTALLADPALAERHRVHAVRGHLLELAGDPAAAESFRQAAGLTRSLPEQRYLNRHLECSRRPT